MNVHSSDIRSTSIAFFCAKLALPEQARQSQHLYEVRPTKDHRGIDLIFDALPFDRFTVASRNGVSNAIDLATF